MPDESPSWSVVCSALSVARGEGNSITIGRLAAMAGLPRREVEVLLECHWASLPFTVVAGPRGLFRPTSPDELDHYLAALRSRIRCIAIRHAATRRVAQREGWLRQDRRFVAAPPAPNAPPPGYLFDPSALA